MRLSLTLLFLLISQLLFSADLTTERVGETSLLTLRIDRGVFNSKDGEVAYRAIFEVLNSKGKIVFLEKEDILFAEDEVSKSSKVVIFFETELEPGAYTGYLKINSSLRNDRNEEKIEFVIDKNRLFSELYLFRKLNETNIEVVTWEDIDDYSDVYLYQLYEESPARLSLVSENEAERKVTDIAPTNKLYQPLDKDYFVPAYKNNYIEFYLHNLFYQSELKLATYLNSFQKKYSWEDQLEQIRYIVNNKTWREINRGKLSDSEKVLRFWASQNPANSSNNELQNIFYNRVLQADQRFSVHKYKQGWKTDRGRIFIKFGEPDEISVDNLPVGRYPAQKWHYYQLNKTFYFYDRTGIEDYKLYNKEEEYGF